MTRWSAGARRHRGRDPCLDRGGARDMNTLKAATRAAWGRVAEGPVPADPAAFPRGGRFSGKITVQSQRPLFHGGAARRFRRRGHGDRPAKDRRSRTRPTRTRGGFEPRGLRRGGGGGGERGCPRRCPGAAEPEAARDRSVRQSGQGSNKAAIGGIRATHSTPGRSASAWSRCDLPPPGRNGRTNSSGSKRLLLRGLPRARGEALKDLLKIQSRYGLNIAGSSATSCSRSRRP